MNVPAKSQKQWADIVTGRKTYELKFLAAKIMLGRLVRSVGPTGSPESIRDHVVQLPAVYEKSAASPSVQADLKTIFG